MEQFRIVDSAREDIITSKSAVPAGLRNVLGIAGLVALVALGLGTPSASAAPQQGPWTLPAVKISGDADYEDDASVAYSPDGSATAVWSTYDDDTGENLIVAADKPADGIFGTAYPISAVSTDVRDPQIAIGPDGSATAVWQITDGPDVTIQAASRPPGGSFGAAVDISTEVSPTTVSPFFFAYCATSMGEEFFPEFEITMIVSPGSSWYCLSCRSINRVP